MTDPTLSREDRTMKHTKDCIACFENGRTYHSRLTCSLYLDQRAAAARLRRLLVREPDPVLVPKPPDYSTQEAVTARCHEVGLWSSFGGKPDRFKADSEKAEIYRLLAKPTGLYSAFRQAVALREG